MERFRFSAPKSVCMTGAPSKTPSFLQAHCRRSGPRVMLCVTSTNAVAQTASISSPSTGTKGNQNEKLGARFLFALRWVVLLTFAILFETAAVPAMAAPLAVGFSGKLSNAAGVPITADVAMFVRLFATETGGQPLFSESQGTVPVVSGSFELWIGATLPIDLETALLSTDDVWMELQIGNETLAPRLAVLSAPFALVAANAESLDGLAADAFVQVEPTGGINVQSIAIAGKPVIDPSGAWVGPSSGLVGPMGPAGPKGETGPLGPMGPPGMPPVGTVQVANLAPVPYMGPPTDLQNQPVLYYVNPRLPPYNAKADGVTDDTQAIQLALNALSPVGGGIVQLPPGVYRIHSHINVPPHVTLAGTFRSPPTTSVTTGTMLWASEGKGTADGTAFVHLQGPNAGIEGIGIFYPEQVVGQAPIPFPWTIRGQGDNVFVKNVFLLNSYNGIDMGTFPSGRHNIHGVTGQPLNIGIYVNQCYDVGRIKEVHFWPFFTIDPGTIDVLGKKAIAIALHRTDWEVIEDVFTWGYGTGLHLSNSPQGASNGVATNLQFDNVDIGIDVHQTQEFGFTITNLNIANAGAGTNRLGIWGRPGGLGHVTIQGAVFWGSLYQAVRWQGGGTFSMANSRVVSWSGASPGAIDILGGRAMISGMWFADVVGTSIHVGPNTDRVTLMGNQLVGNPMNLQGSSITQMGNAP